MVNVLFVCLGNICRSPTAEGIFRQMVTSAGLDGRITADSAGTSDWHVGEPPDRRSQAAAKRRGIDLSNLRGRQVQPADFDRFHYVIAMDASNFAKLSALAPPPRRDRLHMMLDFAPELGVREVPDPYSGGEAGFETVLDLLETASQGLIGHIRDHDLG